MNKYFIVLIFVLAFVPHHVWAQEEYDSLIVNKKVPFWRRFSIHTNVVDWSLTTPNGGIEFDLGGTQATRFSLLFHGKLNWNTKHTINPRFVWNVASAGVEVRKYWRTGVSDDPSLQTFEKYVEGNSRLRYGILRFRHRVTSGHDARFWDARWWRAYYVGLYAGADKYTYCFGSEGKQGRGLSGGITAGYTLPLYYFKGGAGIDFELGATLVGRATKYTQFKYMEETGCYHPDEIKGWHVVPYPVLQEIRVGFALRLNSINNKVKGGIHRYEERLKRINTRMNDNRMKYVQDTLKADSARAARELANTLKKMQKDSIKQAEKLQDSLKVLQKDSIKQAAMLADSLKVAQRDSLKRAGQLEKEMRKRNKQIQDSLEEVRKDSLKQMKRKDKRKAAEKDSTQAMIWNELPLFCNEKRSTERACQLPLLCLWYERKDNRINQSNYAKLAYSAEVYRLGGRRV